MTASSTSSTNDVNTAKPAYEVSTASHNVNTPSAQVSTTSFRSGSNRFEVPALSTKYEGKESVSTVTRWDTLPGSIEHQGTRRVSSEIKTTLGSMETKTWNAGHVLP
ncbi:hypothetical protein Tco_0823158 [Tanacetum coccineum]|uniref:Uncharacterized protein n=1 Tax=Tanacetum coccineum TaxID=301880 RepID=A0ABQ5AM17_9ASTR